MGDQGRQEHLRELAGGTWRPGKRRSLGAVKNTPDSIGYIELIYAIQNHISYGEVQNSAGTFVKASLAGVSEAAAGAARNMPDDFRVSITNAPGKDTYPISSFHVAPDPGTDTGRPETRYHQGLPEVDAHGRPGVLRRAGLRQTAGAGCDEGDEGDLTHPVTEQPSPKRRGLGPERDGSNSTTTGPAGVGWHPQALIRRLRSGDSIAHAVTLIFAASILMITVYAGVSVVGTLRDVRAQNSVGIFCIPRLGILVFENFGALPFLYGTVLTTGLSLLIAVPLGLGAAIFLAELAPPKLSAGLSYVIDLLAAVPSVIYGLLAMFTLVPLLSQTVEPFLKKKFGFLPIFKGPAYGVGFLAAGLVLSVMIVPFIVSVSREVLLSVPADQREAALGLGATRWETTWKVVVPYARSGIMGSLFLSMARALGETMAVTMVIGNTPRISASLLALATRLRRLSQTSSKKRPATCT